ncbi:MAG: hypothetical protein CFE43_18860 [Burkholderiales bacterium PBB3]|nr:MAG: hypothetical protein CFE43_18860 [Burkholderiales bacterium PBB3]
MNIKPSAPEVLIEDISIVLVGSFNPAIFHPKWFEHFQLMRSNEVEDAKVDLVHHDISNFTIDWVNVQVLQDRFFVSIKADAYLKHLKDLVQGTFQHLSHTPVRQMGLNTTLRLKFKSEEDWHCFGHYLVPKTPWDDVLNRPGMLNVQLRGERTDDMEGFVVIGIEPDIKNPKEVLVRVNDHYEAPRSEKNAPTSASWAVSVLNERFEPSVKTSQELATKLLNGYLAANSVDSGA